MINAIFYFSFVFLIYTYIAYPLLIWLLAWKFSERHTISTPNQLPVVSIVLCVYNSEKLIKNRIKNLLSLDYPGEKLKVIVVADGCTDNTDEQVLSINDDRIELVSYRENRGKSYALSQAKTRITTELVLFADVRQTFETDVLRKMLPYFADAQIAAVTGNLIISGSKGDSGLYWRYEKAIRKCENNYSSLLGVTGAIYMARTALLPDYPADVVLDDMYGPLTMIHQGHRIAFCEEAHAYDRGSQTLGEEFDRKVRTLAGNYQLVQLLPWVLLPTKNPVFFEFISHKLCRLFVPIFLILLFFSSIFKNDWLAMLMFLGQLSFYTLAIFLYFYLYKRKGKSNFVLSFVMLNLAALKAGVIYWTSSTSRLWKSH